MSCTFHYTSFLYLVNTSLAPELSLPPCNPFFFLSHCPLAPSARDRLVIWKMSQGIFAHPLNDLGKEDHPSFSLHSP